MSVIKTLTVRVDSDIGPLGDGFSRALAEAEGLARDMRNVEVSPGVGGAGGGISAVGDQIRDALLVGMVPLRAMAAQFSAAFDRVGGTVVTLGRRIDLAMKDSSGFTERQLRRMELGFKGLGI